MACYGYKKGRRGIKYIKSKSKKEAKKFKKSKYNVFGQLMKRAKKVIG